MQCSAVVEAAQSAAVVVSGSVGREDAVQGVGITALRHGRMLLATTRRRALGTAAYALVN